MSTPDFAASMLRITELAEKIGGLDSRESEHYQGISANLRTLAEQLAADRARMRQQGQSLAALDGLDTQVAELADAVARLAPPAEESDGDKLKPYKPAPTPRWWALTGDERQAAIAQLRAWAEDIYLPGYGYLAVLPPCWAQHDLILYALDTISQLWMVLYLGPRTPATLAGQAELQTRILPQYAEQIRTEARSCSHATASGPRP